MPRSPDILNRETIFTGSKVALEVHRIRAADGREATREVVRHRGSVAILAEPAPGMLLLEKVWRYPVGDDLLELPAGTLEEGEEPAACAIRELAEETGYRAARVERLLTVYTSPGFLDEQITLYLATDVTPGEPAREAGEVIENVLLPVEEALAMIADGRIRDGKTVCGILYWQAYRHGVGAAGEDGA